MSRLSPENKALIRAAIRAHDKDSGLMALGGLIFFPLLFLLGSIKKTTAKQFDLGPRSTRVFERIIEDRDKKSQRLNKAA